jgi:NADPH-dependent curcumin reductase CurA
VTDGLDSAAQALLALLDRGNIGKMLVRLAEDPYSRFRA